MKNVRHSRRDALKSGCAVTAGLAVPAFIRSTALGDANTPPPSDRVTLGHIGVGGRGSFLLQATQKGRGIQSVAVADCYEDRREAAAAAIAGTAYADFRRILDRKDIDGVIVATPDHWHVPIAVMAAQAGKDVYLEKPMGLTLEQDLRCQTIFREQNRIFQYGTQQREAKHQQFGRELIRSGKLGELQAIEVQAPNGGSGGSTESAAVPPGFDYEMWLGPAPRTPYAVDRCKPKGTYWIYDQSIGYLAGWVHTRWTFSFGAMTVIKPVPTPCKAAESFPPKVFTIRFTIGTCHCEWLTASRSRSNQVRTARSSSAAKVSSS